SIRRRRNSRRGRFCRREAALSATWWLALTGACGWRTAKSTPSPRLKSKRRRGRAEGRAGRKSWLTFHDLGRLDATFSEPNAALRRGGTCRLLAAHPCLHVLPIGVVLGCKLPSARVGIGHATRFRHQRH